MKSLQEQIDLLEEGYCLSEGKGNCKYFKGVVSLMGGNPDCVIDSVSKNVKGDHWFSDTKYSYTNGSSFIHILQYQNLLLMRRLLVLEEKLSDDPTTPQNAEINYKSIFNFIGEALLDSELNIASKDVATLLKRYLTYNYIKVPIYTYKKIMSHPAMYHNSELGYWLPDHEDYRKYQLQGVHKVYRKALGINWEIDLNEGGC